MRMPGFTAEAALGPSPHKYRRLNSADITGAQVITPQGYYENCSDDGRLCYECDDEDGGTEVCNWYYDGHFIVTTVQEPRKVRR